MSEIENQDVDVVEEAISEEEIVEGTAQASLKPNATKSEVLSKIMGHFAGMKKEDLTAFFHKTQDQVGKEPDKGLNTSGSNQASINTSGAGKPSPSVAKEVNPFTGSVKEDMDEMFAGQDDLSEDFKSQASTLFEAAINNRMTIEVARLEEEFETKLEEEVTATIDELQEQVSKYMDYVTEKWMEENSAVLESNYRSEATEKFIEGMKSLFAEHYVEMPEEKVDMIADFEKKIADLEEAMEKTQAENIELNSIIEEAKLEATFDDIAEGLADTQVEKLKSLSEGIEYVSTDDYAAKLDMIKKQYFSEGKDEEASSTGLINEENIASNDEEDKPAYVPEEMKDYVSAISRSLKK